MHVPDGVLPLWVYILFLAISLPILGLAIRNVNRRFDDRLTPYMGVLAAVIFAAQFVNFPVPPASGHLVGTTLLAVMLGPWAAMVIMALVLFVQALYGDGGLFAFGLNFFNMGVLGAIFGWGLAFVLFKGLAKFRDEKISVLVATAIAAFVTTIGTAFILGLELLTIPGLSFEFVYIITGVHGFIALGEAILTFVILLYFVKAKPKMISFLEGSDTSMALNRRTTLSLTPTTEEGN
ncbi:MAG: energy-coupling factor ABC transporter permease [Candidatus Thorarchaeota archaeon]